MGSFIGHAIPAAALTVVGLMWYIHVLLVLSKLHTKLKLLDIEKNNLTVYLTPNIYVTALMLPLFLLGAVTEYFHHAEGPGIHNVQHITIYLGYGGFALAELLERRHLWPKDSAGLAFFIASFNEFIMMIGHSATRNLENRLHSLTLAVAGVAMLFNILVLYKPTLWTRIGLAFCTTLHGLMYWLTAITIESLNVDRWVIPEELDTMEEIMWAHTHFAWIVSVLSVLFISSFAAAKSYGGNSPVHEYAKI